jgi:hypothetical protein
MVVEVSACQAREGTSGQGDTVTRGRVGRDAVAPLFIICFKQPLNYFQFSAIQGVGKTRRYHFPLRPINASGGLGTP